MRKKIDHDAFVAAWRAADSLDDVVAATGLVRSSVSQLATRLRKRGVELKRFSERAQRPESLSNRAARAAHDEGATYRTAAARFNISHQAVQQAYARLYPGEAPPRGRADLAARAVAVELSLVGRPDDEVAAEVGFSPRYVGKLRLDAGRNLAAEKDAAMRAAVEAVRAGTPAARAASDHGVSYGHLAERCREIGVPLAGQRGRRDGVSVAAADIVELEGVTVSEAARRVGCTAPAVRGVLKRRLLASS